VKFCASSGREKHRWYDIPHKEGLGLTGIEKVFSEMNEISGGLTALYWYWGERDFHQLAKSSREVLRSMLA